jgi:exopolysaccharide biosynthesis polyprenyl glycosylphosphotransferase
MSLLSLVPIAEPLIVGWWVPVLMAAVVALVLLRSVPQRVRRTQFFARRVVVLGAGPIAAVLIDEIKAATRSRYVIAGIVDEVAPDGAAAALWLGTCRELAEIVERVRPTHIVVALADRRRHLPFTPLLESRIRSGVVVEDALEFYERLTGKMAIEAVSPGALILSKGFCHRGLSQLVARAISVTVSAVGLVLLAPLLAAIGVAIKIDSAGPVFFVQDRAGWGGRPFKLLKFRTMHPCDRPASEWVRDNTDRITRVGNYLRRLRFDELPQLVNVLRGEMNLIGPRPHPTANHQMFLERIAYYGLRSAVRPGVTGWAQVKYGYANNLVEETEKMRYDLYYIKNRSLWLDLRILLETVVIMAVGGGASQVRQTAPRSTFTLASARGRRRHARAAYASWLAGAPPARPSIGRH